MSTPKDNDLAQVLKPLQMKAINRALGHNWCPKHQCTAIFRFLQRWLIGFKSADWLGLSTRFTQSGHESTLCYLGCVFRVIVLFDDEPSSQSEV